MTLCASRFRGLVVLGLLVVGLACDAGEEGGDDTGGMRLTSSAFENEGTIPGKHAAEGVSPPVAWSDVPRGTKSLALIVDDPDAAGFTHWVLYDILPSAGGLAEDRPSGDNLFDPAGARQGPSDRPGPAGWFGPEPPPGETHRYAFTLYALDVVLSTDGLGKDEILEHVEGHVLGKAVLVGKYGR